MDDKFKKDLSELMDQFFEQRFINWFNRGFEEVAMPQIEMLREEIQTNFASKKDLMDVKKDIQTLNNNQERMQNSLDRVIDKHLDYEKGLKI